MLRRSFDDSPKISEMHFLYISDTTDERVYEKEDWHDLIGEENNVYYRYDNHFRQTLVDRPPRVCPVPEEKEWQRILEAGLSFPQQWFGEIPQMKYVVRTNGILVNHKNRPVSNPQGIPELIEDFSGYPIGRIRVTPKNNLILMYKDGICYVIGQIKEALTLHHQKNSTSQEFQSNSDLGTYKNINRGIRLDQWKNRTYKRRFFIKIQDSKTQELREKANQIDSGGLVFYINSDGIAWYVEKDGTQKILADVSDGFFIDRIEQQFLPVANTIISTKEPQ